MSIGSRKDPSAEYEQLMGRPFGRIYKPRYATREQCTGKVEVRSNGSWACLECGAKASRRRESGGTAHRRMEDSPFWAFAWGQNGKKFSRSTKSRDHADAVKLKREILKQVLAGRQPWLTRNEATLNELCDMVRVHYTNEGNRSVKSLELQIRTLQRFPSFTKGGVKARLVTEARVEELKAWLRGEGYANGTIRLVLAVLRQGFKMALRRLDEHGMPMLDRMPTIRMPRGSPPREGFFEDDEFEAVRAELLRGNPTSSPGDLADLAEFYFLTGWRNAEPRALQWPNVNWFAKTLTLPAALAKGKQARTFPFGGYDQLEELLRRRWRATEAVEHQLGRKIPWIFFRQGRPDGKRCGRPIRDFSKAWRAACLRAGVSERTPHDFRRTACRNIYEATGDLVAACNLVGWQSIEMALRYKIHTMKDGQAAVAKLAAWRQERAREREASLQMSLRFGRKT